MKLLRIQEFFCADSERRIVREITKDNDGRADMEKYFIFFNTADSWESVPAALQYGGFNYCRELYWKRGIGGSRLQRRNY